VCGPHDNINVTHMALGGPSVWHACHRVHTFILPRHCSILAWWWLFTAETCCQNSKILSISLYILCF